jgi:glutathione S-transferase
MEVYVNKLSQPSRAVLAFLDLNGVPYTEKPVQINKGEQHKPEFLAINPLG